MGKCINVEEACAYECKGHGQSVEGLLCVVMAVFSQPTRFFSVKEGVACVRDDSNSEPTPRLDSQHIPHTSLLDSPLSNVIKKIKIKKTTGGRIQRSLVLFYMLEAFCRNKKPKCVPEA